MKPSQKLTLIFLVCIIVPAVLGYFLSSNSFLGGKAVSAGVYPRKDLTPGIANPNINQSNINQTICNKNWTTKSIRPPSSYTAKLKIQHIKEYGYKDTNPANYSEDHLIALTNGGHPTDPKNLWPQAHLTKPNSYDKDKLENHLNKLICNGTLTLKEAQRQISSDWVYWYKKYGLDKSLGGIFIEEGEE